MKLIRVAQFALLALSVGAAQAQDVSKVGVAYLSSQRISGQESVVVEGDSAFAWLAILVTIDVDGKVLDATVSQNVAKADPKPALAAAREWIFRPQLFDGRPVQAVGTIHISYRVPEIPADPSVPFPEGSLNDTEIKLYRSSCLGACPDYTVSIGGDGTVRFSSGFDEDGQKPFSSENIVWSGKHVAKVDPQAVAGLIERFRAAHFMGLRSDYTADVTDIPTYSLTLRVGKTTKSVIDYMGWQAGMPSDVNDLEDAVDVMAKSDRWVRGNAETVALLKAQGFDFKSKDAALLVLNGIRLNSWSRDRSAGGDLILSAVAEDLDLSHLVDIAASEEPQEMTPIGVVITRYAAWSGNEPLFDEMTRRGQLARMSQQDLDDAFHAGAGCSVKIAKALVASGANINAPMQDGNALHAVRFSDGDSPCAGLATDRHIEMIRTLIGLGIRFDVHDEFGQSPLIGVSDPDVVQILLAAGADPNARDAKGTPAILATHDDRVAVLLLRAGADPLAKNSEGNLSDRARKLHWPATIAWLQARGIR